MRMTSSALVIVVAAPCVAGAAPHVLAGELARVSLTRRAVAVKVAGTPPREVDVRVTPDTVISSRGRPLRLTDLRPGERITISCVDDAGVHNARRIKLGGRPRPATLN